MRRGCVSRCGAEPCRRNAPHQAQVKTTSATSAFLAMASGVPSNVNVGIHMARTIAVIPSANCGLVPNTLTVFRA